MGGRWEGGGEGLDHPSLEQVPNSAIWDRLTKGRKNKDSLPCEHREVPGYKHTVPT